MEHRAAKEVLSLVSLSCTSFHLCKNFTSTKCHDRPDSILALKGYPDCGFSVKIPLASTKVSLAFSKSLEVHNNYTPRTTKVLKAATFGRTDKHKGKMNKR
jgi:hypothetical protein